MTLAAFGYLLPDYVRSELGYQAGIAGADPAAGATFSRTVPGDYFEILVSVRAVLTTNATVASRSMSLQARDENNTVIHAVPGTIVVPASTLATFRWSLALTSAYAADVTSQNLPLFPFVMPSSWSLRINPSNMQAGDQLSGIGLVLQRYPTGPSKEIVKASLLIPVTLPVESLEAASSSEAGQSGAGTAESPAATTTATTTSADTSASPSAGETRGPSQPSSPPPVLTPIPGSGTILRA